MSELTAEDVALSSTNQDPVDSGVFALLPEESPLIAGSHSAELAYRLAQCGPHPPARTLECLRGVGPHPPQPAVVVDPAPEMETAPAQLSPTSVSTPGTLRNAVGAVRSVIATGLAHTGGPPDLSLMVLALATLFVVGLAMRRVAVNPRSSLH